MKFMEKNKRAWLRIIEAFLAVLIILSAVLIVMSKNKPVNLESSEDVYNKQRQILDIIVNDNFIREDIMNNNVQKVNDSISGMIPQSWGFATKICEINDICNAETPNDRDVYSSEAIIASTLNIYDPKKLRFFVWRK